MKVYGVNAAKALFERRAQDIIRAYVTTPKMKDFGTLLKWCAANKKAYHVLTEPELERVSSSVHHEGVVLVAKEPQRLGDKDLRARLAALPPKCALVWLDGVGNPHNIGAILRLMSHFGAPLVLGRQGELPNLTPALARIAEGGIEHVTFAALAQPTDAVAELKAAGFKLIVTAASADRPLFQAELPNRVVFVLGNESTGVSSALNAAADGRVSIPGTGAVESLNVSHAAALCLGEFWRRQAPAR
jgi:TrmH RNA methyltransferase